MFISIITFYELYIVRIRYYKSFIYIDMMVTLRERWCIILEGSPICSVIEKVVYCVIWKMLYYIVPYSLSEID